MAQTSATSPGTMADDATVGTVAWTNPNNAKVSDNVYTEGVTVGNQRTHYLKATNFGFSIPTGATINGIFVEQESKTVAGVQTTLGHSIVKSDGSIGTEVKNIINIPSTEAYRSVGSSTDLWSEVWAPANINSVNFGVVVDFFASDRTFDIDHIRITVYYTEAVTGTSKFLQFF